MARKNTNEELWLEVSAAGIYRDAATPGTGALNSQAAAGQSDLVLGTGEGAGFTVGDVVRISSGNLSEFGVVESIATDTLTLHSFLAFTHATGIAVTEQEEIDLGAVSEDGITRETTVERTEIRAVTQATAYANLVVSVGQRITWNLLNHSLENVMLALGMDESNIHGAGSQADPSVADLTAENMEELLNHCLWFRGALKDATTFEIQGWAVEFDANQTMTYLRGQAVLLPMAADVQHIRYITPL
jgi:hypothetical protein